jgi:hypothetical protein
MMQKGNKGVIQGVIQGCATRDTRNACQQQLTVQSVVAGVMVRQRSIHYVRVRQASIHDVIG